VFSACRYARRCLYAIGVKKALGGRQAAAGRVSANQALGSGAEGRVVTQDLPQKPTHEPIC